MNQICQKSAENLLERAEERFENQGSPKEKEARELFYWILRRLEWRMFGCYPAKDVFVVNVKEEYQGEGKENVLLVDGRVDNYRSEYVAKKEFYEVMEEVAVMFNSIPHYSAKTFVPDLKEECLAELIVHMKI